MSFHSKYPAPIHTNRVWERIKKGKKSTWGAGQAKYRVLIHRYYETHVCAAIRIHKHTLARKKRSTESQLVLLIKLNEVRLHYQCLWKQMNFIILGHIKSNMEKFKTEGRKM